MKDLRHQSSSRLRGWSGLLRIEKRLVSVLLSTTASMVSNLQPIAKPFLPDQFVQFVGVAGSDAVSPADHSKVQRAGRLIGNVQHPDVHQEESQLPQEGESAHPLLVYSLAVGLPVQVARWC